MLTKGQWLVEAIPEQVPKADGDNVIFVISVLGFVENDVDGDASRAREAIEKRFAWLSKLGPR